MREDRIKENHGKILCGHQGRYELLEHRIKDYCWRVINNKNLRDEVHLGSVDGIFVSFHLLSAGERKIVSVSDSSCVPFVTVSAFDKTNRFLCGVHCMETGDFSLESKEDIYKLSFQSIGLKTRYYISSWFQGRYWCCCIAIKGGELKGGGSCG